MYTNLSSLLKSKDNMLCIGFRIEIDSDSRIGYLRSGIGYLLSNKNFGSAYRFLCVFFSLSVRTGVT